MATLSYSLINYLKNSPEIPWGVIG